MKRHVNAVDWTDKAAVRAYRSKYLREYRSRPEVKARRREEAKRYRDSHKDAIAEYRARKRERLKAELDAMSPDERAAYSFVIAKRNRDYRRRPEVVEKTKEYRKRYRAEHKKELSAVESMRQAEIRERCETDPDYYAEHRRIKREQARLRAERKGKSYVPRPSRRKPDWSVMGEDLIDRGSVFLTVNLSDDQLASNRMFGVRRHIETFGSGEEESRE